MNFEKGYEFLHELHWVDSQKTRWYTLKSHCFYTSKQLSGKMHSVPLARGVIQILEESEA